MSLPSNEDHSFRSFGIERIDEHVWTTDNGEDGSTFFDESKTDSVLIASDETFGSVDGVASSKSAKKK